jgi:hypothetical protein
MATRKSQTHRESAPLEGVTIRANFTRLVTEGVSEMKQTTDENGIAGPFISANYW